MNGEKIMKMYEALVKEGKKHCNKTDCNLCMYRHFRDCENELLKKIEIADCK